MASLQHTVLAALARSPEAQRAADLEVDADTAKLRRALMRLVAQGLAERTQRGRYRATEAGRRALAEQRPLQPGRAGPRGVRPGGLAARAWKLIRIEGVVSMGELLRLAGGPQADEAMQRVQLLQYFRALVRAGYARREGAAVRGNDISWRLLVDPGPRAPGTYRNDPKGRPVGLWDPNRQELVPWE